MKTKWNRGWLSLSALALLVALPMVYDALTGQIEVFWTWKGLILAELLISGVGGFAFLAYLERTLVRGDTNEEV